MVRYILRNGVRREMTPEEEEARRDGWEKGRLVVARSRAYEDWEKEAPTVEEKINACLHAFSRLVQGGTLVGKEMDEMLQKWKASEASCPTKPKEIS